MNSKKKLLASTIAFFVGAGGVGSGLAQESVAGQDELDWVLEEIVVTASKRGAAISIQDTAMSITAISGDSIDKKSIVGMNDYLRTLPGVNMIDYGVGQNAIIIRGISADPQLEGVFVGTTVGVYLGETPIAGNAFGNTSDIKMVDIERVEVLRGPQGTLYGSSSLGGTVRNIPVAPNLEKLEARVAVGYSITDNAGTDNYKLEGVVNIPLIGDKLAIRTVAYQFKNGGYVENIAANDAATVASAAAVNAAHLAVNKDDIGNNDYSGYRIAMLYQPKDELRATLSYLNQELEQDGLPESGLDLGTYKQTRLQLGELVGGGEKLANDIEIISLNVEYDFSWASLISASSWIDETFLRNRDIGSFFGGIPIPQATDNQADVFTEELRLSSQLDGPMQFVTGLYYESIEAGYIVDVYWGGDQSFNVFDPTTELIGHAKESFDLTQKTFFGEVTYEIFEQLTVTAGLRAFDYERVDFSVQDGALSGGASSTERRVDDNGTTYKLGLSYTPDDDVLLYANWAEGFRLGRSVPTLPARCDVDNDGIIDNTNVPITHNKTDPDELETFELGGKFTLLDGGATLNTAIYRSDWQGIPLTLISPCGLSVSVNAGEAIVTGFETEAVFYVNPSLRIDVGASYVDAELTEDAPAAGVSKGDRLPGSPEMSFNIGMEYAYTVAGNEAYIRADYAYVGEFYNDVKETGTAAGGYSQVNLKAGWKINDISLDVYVDNLTNADDITWQDTVLSVDNRAVLLRPRTIGVNMAYDF